MKWRIVRYNTPNTLFLFKQEVFNWYVMTWYDTHISMVSTHWPARTTWSACCFEHSVYKSCSSANPSDRSPAFHKASPAQNQAKHFNSVLSGYSTASNPYVIHAFCTPSVELTITIGGLIIPLILWHQSTVGTAEGGLHWSLQRTLVSAPPLLWTASTLLPACKHPFRSTN